MKPIGGYFGLELSVGSNTFHSTIAFKSGRSALHYILKSVKAENVYIPFYTCNALLESFSAAQVPYQFYKLKEDLEPAFLPELKKNEYFLYINYFDLQQAVVQKLSGIYGSHLIIDASQAFFNKGNGTSWLFNSCRKFFGVPDGAYVYPPNHLQRLDAIEKNKQYQTEHLLQRFKGNVKEGYSYFQENEAMCGAGISGMSLLSEQLLSHVNFEMCLQKRKENFNMLHTHLKNTNQFQFEEHTASVPMAYPYLPLKKINHHSIWGKNVFVPILWKDVIERNNVNYNFEKMLSETLLPLPIDQRYDREDMTYIINSLNEL